MYFKLQFLIILLKALWLVSLPAHVFAAAESEFRQDHHFSLSLGGIEGVWHFDQFSHIRDQKITVKGVMTKFSYAFYLPATDNLGYAIGSSLGISKYINMNSADIAIPTSYLLPGLNLAGILQYNEKWCFGIGIDLYAQRSDEIKDLKNNRFLNATFTVYQDKMAFADYFFLDWLAVRIEIHERLGTYQRIAKSSGKLEGAHIYFTERVLALGLIQHGI